MDDKIYLTRTNIQTILRAVANERDFVKSKLREEQSSLEESESLENKLERLNEVHWKLRMFKKAHGI